MRSHLRQPVTAVPAVITEAATLPAQGPFVTRVAPDALPYYGGTGKIGVLLCHGFTGSPASLREWADYLEAEGFRVALPRLPGHGTSWQELNTTGWQDWYAALDRDFRTLTEQCDQVFVCGLSMGGCLALRLAEQHGPAVAGLVLVNPAVRLADKRMRILPVLQRFVPSLKGIASDIAEPQMAEPAYGRNPLRALYSQTKMWADVRAKLPLITQPLLIFRSINDHVVDASSSALILSRVSSGDVEERLLHRSYHVATMDYERQDIFSGSAAFIRRLVMS